MLWVQKNTSNEGLFFVAQEFFANEFWQLNVREEAIKAVTILMLLILNTCTLLQNTVIS